MMNVIHNGKYEPEKDLGGLELKTVFFFFVAKSESSPKTLQNQTTRGRAIKQAIYLSLERLWQPRMKVHEKREGYCFVCHILASCTWYKLFKGVQELSSV